SPAGRTPLIRNRSRTYIVQLGMATPKNLVDGVREFFPCSALMLQHVAALRREPVKPPAALAGLLGPPAVDQAAGLEAAQDRIERPDPDPQAPARSLFDELADLVPVPRARLEQVEDEKLSAPFLQFVVCQGCPAAAAAPKYIGSKYMSVKRGMN